MAKTEPSTGETLKRIANSIRTDASSGHVSDGTMRLRLLAHADALLEAADQLGVVPPQYRSGTNDSGPTSICPACCVTDPRIRLCVVHASRLLEKVTAWRECVNAQGPDLAGAAFQQCIDDVESIIGPAAGDVVPPSPASDLPLIRKRLQWVRKFIEYARYELQPGEQQSGDQFPRQSAADKAMREIDDVLSELASCAPRPAGGWQPIETAPKDGRDVFIYEDGVWPAVNVARFERFSDGSMGWISKCTIWPRVTASCMLRPRLWHPMIELPPSLGVPPPSPETK